MTAEGNLYNPCLFAGISPLASEICLQFTEITHTYPYPTLSSVRGHLFKMLHHVFLQPEYADYRQQLAAANTFDEMENMVKNLHSALLLVYGKCQNKKSQTKNYYGNLIRKRRDQPAEYKV